MTGRGDHGDDDFDDAVQPEPDERPDAGRDDSDDSGEEELLDQAWQQSHGGSHGLRWLLVLLVIPVVALVVLQLRPDTPRAASPTASSTRGTMSPRPTTSSPTPGPDAAVVHARSWRQTTDLTPVVRKLGHPLLGVTAGWELFTWGPDAVTRVQPAAGKVTTTKLPHVGDRHGVSFVVTSAGAFVRSGKAPGQEVLDGQPARPLIMDQLSPGALTYGLLPGPDPDHAWTLSASGDGSAAVLLNSRLYSTGTVLRLPGDVSPGPALDSLSSVAGGFVVRTTQGYYAVDKGGLRSMPGVAVAVGPTTWVVVVRGIGSHGTRFVFDSRTLAVRKLPGPRTPGARLGLPVGRVSPDGSTMATLGSSHGSPTLVLTDLSSGVRQRVARLDAGSSPGFGRSMAWSPDSRWLFFPDTHHRVGVVDAKTGKVSQLRLGLPDVLQVAVRPAP